MRGSPQAQGEPNTTDVLISLETQLLTGGYSAVQKAPFPEFSFPKKENRVKRSQMNDDFCNAAIRGQVLACSGAVAMV
ncbi:hypothetical protein [uncultured Pelagimonas sp.]|uniref:hypothetical protein n=1 Tax=uncultured Pelagimonas sp. TaxID=1618102 RepID=UPI002608B080|nr:hypothetical protein [uncultured Pelagimonas sp.]